MMPPSRICQALVFSPEQRPIIDETGCLHVEPRPFGGRGINLGKGGPDGRKVALDLAPHAHHDVSFALVRHAGSRFDEGAKEYTPG